MTHNLQKKDHDKGDRQENALKEVALILYIRVRVNARVRPDSRLIVVPKAGCGWPIKIVGTARPGDVILMRNCCSFYHCTSWKSHNGL